MWPELSGRLVLESPAGLVFLLALPLLLASWLRSSRRDRSLSVALGLRVTAAVLVVLAVSGIALERHEPADEICIVVSADLSESVGPAAAGERDRIVADLVARLRRSDRLGAVAFGRSVEVVSWPVSPPRPPQFRPGRIDPSATRLAGGIEAAVPLCPESSERTVVLVTDGNETLGDARRAAAFARQSGVRLFAVVPGASGQEGLSFEKLVAPPLVREGSIFPLRLMVRNGFAVPTAGRIDLAVNGEPAAEQPVRFDPGVNVFEIPWQLHERGSYRLTARVAAEGLPAEHRREVSLAVAGPIRALVISDVADPALGRALRLKEVDVEFRRPKELPPLEDLLQYHCVIFDDVPRKAFDDERLRGLESYVKNFGGGFLMTGGAQSFGDAGWQKSPVERVLPVSFVEQKPKPKGRAPMGVFLLVDRSNSMSYNSRRRDLRDGELMTYAKQAALALVGQLRADDRVGVIAFDSDPYVLGPLRPLSEHRGQLVDRISRLAPGGGTDFKAALEIAASQLAGSGLRARHVLLLTDGDTNRGAPDHYPLIQALAKMAISVTTLRIGTDDLNLELLKKISQDTGGRFYHVRDIERLPQLLVSDARQASGGEEPQKDSEAPQPAPEVSLALGEPSPIVKGFRGEDFPPLRQMMETNPKPDADLVLYATSGPRKLPLIASWQYGLGRTASFPLDPSAPDAARWVGWTGFGKLWSQLVRWAIREETPWETRHAIRFEEGTPLLEVQTFDDAEEGTIVAQIFTAPQQSIDLQLVPAAPRVFRAPLPPLQPGRYALLLTRRSGEKTLAQRRDVLAIEGVVEEGGSPELARKLPDLELLSEITAEAGGSVNPSLEELTARRGATRVVRQALDWAIIPLALALLLGDISIRRRLAA